jgi:hypothetical protein
MVLWLSSTCRRVPEFIDETLLYAQRPLLLPVLQQRL